MQLWAAIDIMSGRVVTLLKGSPSSSTYWDMGPVDAARRWEREGADGLHLVDLDRATGSHSNEAVVREVLASVRIPVQVGGGIRTVSDALRVLAMGASRIVVSTLAYSSPSALRNLVETAGANSIVVAADYKEGRVLTHGWTLGGTMGVLEAARYVEELGVRTLLVTDAERDGTAAGPDLGTCRRLRRATNQTILASGGIRSREDIDELGRLGVDGVVLGRALYEGSIRLSDVWRVR